MPLIEDTPNTPVVQKPVPVIITAPEYRGVTVDTRYDPLLSLLTNIEGAKWTVNYYSQVVAQDNALSGQNLGRNAANQQYRRITGMVLNVTSPLSTSQDNTTKQMTVTGQAHIVPGTLIPNEGDHFLADIGDGREVVFIITESNRLSVNKDSAYQVSYEIVAYSDQDQRVQDLNVKTVQDLYYQADFLMHGQNPMITLGEKHHLEKLTGYMEELRDYYFNKFFSREYATLLLPGQQYPVYDPFLTHAVLGMFRDDLHPNLKKIRELNVDEDDNYLIANIWTAVKNKRRRDLIGAMKRVGLVTAKGFTLNPIMDSLRYSGVHYAVYPADPDKSHDYLRKDYTKPLSDWPITYTLPRFVDLFDLIATSELYGINREGANTPVRRVKAVNPITADSYIFSMAFYRGEEEGQSALELLLQQYLDDKAMHLPGLTILAGSYTSWGVLEQFYQLPFVMMMIRAAIRRL